MYNQSFHKFIGSFTYKIFFGSFIWYGYSKVGFAVFDVITIGIYSILAYWVTGEFWRGVGVWR